MKAIVFGATGMVGQAVVKECLADAGVERVLTVGRQATGVAAAKLAELVHEDFLDFAPVAGELTGYDACFWCLGITSAGLSEAAYTRITYDYTMAAATVLARVNPQMAFIFISGAGTDGSEKGPTMWARVKGRAENAVLALPFKCAYALRPAIIQPKKGVRSKTVLYRLGYLAATPLFPLLRRFTNVFITSDQLGRAMIHAARHGAPKKVLENLDILALK